MSEESDILKIVKEDILKVVGKENEKIPLKSIEWVFLLLYLMCFCLFSYTIVGTWGNGLWRFRDNRTH
jgi:nitrate reductase NapE component